MIAKTSFSTVAAVVGAVSMLLAQSSNRAEAIYVAEFVSASVADRTLLASFTDSFETALVNTGRYRILNRRNLNRILAESRSEAAIRSMDNLSAQERQQIMTFEDAKGVVFGEVTDDAQGGEIRITVALEEFDSTKRWQQSISIKRGLLFDPSSRQAAMVSLAEAASASQQVPAALAPPFVNDFLVVSVESASVSTDGRRAALALTFYNKGSVEEFLSTSCCPGASMTDSGATNRWVFNYNQSSGLSYRDYFRRGEPYHSEDLAAMTRFAPGEKHAVVLTFDGIDSSTGRPSSVSFSMPLFRRRGSEVQRMSVGISRISIVR